MKIVFLGTGAGGGLPGMFCRCEVCRKARDLGGKNIRSRASMQIDRDVQIGFTPDAFSQTQLSGHAFGGVRHLLLTHNHYDHLTPEALRYRRPPYAYGAADTVTVYGPERVLEALRSTLRDPIELGYDLFEWRPGEGHSLDRMEVIPIESDHDRRQPCYALIIVRDNRRLLYALDVGEADDRFFGRLPEMRFDAVVIDCALGLAEHKPGAAHLNLDAVIALRQKLELTGHLSPRALVYLSQITHHMALMHQEIEFELRERSEDILVAYDGLTVDLNKDD